MGAQERWQSGHWSRWARPNMYLDVRPPPCPETSSHNGGGWLQGPFLPEDGFANRKGSGLSKRSMPHWAHLKWERHAEVEETIRQLNTTRLIPNRGTPPVTDARQDDVNVAPNTNPILRPPHTESAAPLSFSESAGSNKESLAGVLGL